MKVLNDKNHFGLVSISLHWLMAVLILLAYISIEMHDFFDKGTDARAFADYLHHVVGLSILALVIVRLAFKLMQKSPTYLSNDPMQIKLATIMHWVLYGFMFIMPVLGWLTLSAEGKELIILGAQLPQLVMANHDLAEIFEESHEIIGQFGYLLIGVHALAGLLHHYLFQDATLLRMLGKKADQHNTPDNNPELVKN
ncbi:superoxide oxidase [uncultured Thiomicrorhabdus sp.]